MIFALNIPELKGPISFPGQFVNALMGPQCPSYAGQAMLTSFIRFVEAARAQYRMGNASAQSFAYEPHNIYGFIDASSAFEACVGYMHRAILCMKAIRSQEAVAEISRTLFSDRPVFMGSAVRSRLRIVRNAIQHSSEKVLDGSISDGAPFMLLLAGTELPTPTADDAKQTTKTWDGVEIGDIRISFTDISTWLNEMALAAEAIVGYRPPTVEVS